MGTYTADQWVLFFFFYSLCGWIWECCYVSACKRQWVNRGFLHGPMLPIYGFGAVIILLFTIPVRGNLWLVYFCGMAAATALEYVTGAVMEWLFKVRYWDYSNQRCNLSGYICLSSSVAWGFFSILLVRLIHPPIAELILDIPAAVVSPLALALTALFAVDAAQSVRAAMDLRKLLEKLTEENEDLRRLAKRIEVVSAFAGEDLQHFRDRTQAERLLLQDRLEYKRRELAEAKADRQLRRTERFGRSLRTVTAVKLRVLDELEETLEACRAQMVLPDAAEKKAELDEILGKLHDRRAALRARTEEHYRRSLRILWANPSAKAKKYAEAMETLRDYGGIFRD